MAETDCPLCGNPGEFLEQGFEPVDAMGGISIVNLLACRNPDCSNYIPRVIPDETQKEAIR